MHLFFDNQKTTKQIIWKCYCGDFALKNLNEISLFGWFEKVAIILQDFHCVVTNWNIILCELSFPAKY